MQFISVCVSQWLQLAFYVYAYNAFYMYQYYIVSNGEDISKL